MPSCFAHASRVVYGLRMRFPPTAAFLFASACVSGPTIDQRELALAIPWDEMTPLQRHVSFFDDNSDGYVTVCEERAITGRKVAVTM